MSLFSKYLPGSQRGGGKSSRLHTLPARSDSLARPVTRNTAESPSRANNRTTRMRSSPLEQGPGARCTPLDPLQPYLKMADGSTSLGKTATAAILLAHLLTRLSAGSRGGDPCVTAARPTRVLGLAPSGLHACQPSRSQGTFQQRHARWHVSAVAQSGCRQGPR